MTDNKRLIVTAAPHLHQGLSTARIMWSVTICLLPAAVWSIIIFGLPALLTLCASIIAAVVTELIVALVRKKATLQDGSAFLTGLLVGFNMPPEVPGFIPIVASVFAILVVKHVFGGLGRNWMNPALAGRAFVMFSWTGQMTSWSLPGTVQYGLVPNLTNYREVITSGPNMDILAGATPLAKNSIAFLKSGTYWDLFMGNVSGCIGEVSAFLLLLGAVYLFIKKIITWEVPVGYLGTFALLTLCFGGFSQDLGFFQGDVVFHLFAGGIMLGALYMATDMVTSPLTAKGMLIYGAGCGLLTFLIRFYGGLPEGVSMAILIMNIGVPLIDKLTKPVKFGFVKEEQNAEAK